MAAPFPNLKEHEILSLRQKIEKEMAHEQSEKPQIISFKNQQFVVKFARQEKKRDRQEKLSAAAYFLLFRKWLSPRCFEALTVKQEAKRIINLNALNLQVAPIYYYNEQYFIQAYSGVSLDTVLPRTKKTQQLFLIYDVFSSLAQLHRQGQWHGGPQIRNITLYNKQLYRIDFEERFGFYTPIALSQSYDLMLTFNSIKKFLNDDLQLGQKLFMHYWHLNPDKSLLPYLNKVLKWLKPIYPISQFLGRINKHNNDINTSLFFGQVLKNCLPALSHQTQS